MSLQFGTRIYQSHSVLVLNNSFFSAPLPLCIHTRTFISQTLNQSLAIETETATMRPVCPACSKPSRVCLCSRIKTRNLDNSVSVTILQHTLERNHPLNSTRIATLGLRNINIYSVSDVNFDARFVIQSPESDSEVGSDGFLDPSSNFPTGEESVERESEVEHKNKRIRRDGVVEPLISFSIAKYGAIRSLKHQWMVPQAQCENPNFDLLLASLVAKGDLAKGFVVKKWQNRKLDGRRKLEEFEEFEIVIPPGTALLFPSEQSIGFEAINFQVKNLIVLDGTWSKAKRIYIENPWLKLLPHLKLDLDKMSLYGEVRTQPRAGYLSTIESIVYAMKAVGDETQGLDNLLEVFESMVVDQRRCMNERLNQISMVGILSGTIKELGTGLADYHKKNTKTSDLGCPAALKVYLSISDLLNHVGYVRLGRIHSRGGGAPPEPTNQVPVEQAVQAPSGRISTNRCCCLGSSQSDPSGRRW